jgi:ribosomal protein S18 acetylase RimI-like enzyme
MSDQAEYVTVDGSNAAEHGFFCYKSKPKTEGYRNKTEWLARRFEEGLKLQLVYEDGRSVGFIEYIPAEYAWRAVEAPGYSVIHCVWVVGRAKNQGYASRLLQNCIDDVRRQGKRGVVMVASNRVWLAGPHLFRKHGFQRVDEAQPFELLVHRFDEHAPLPAFPTNWQQRCEAFGPGLTVIHASQCPYIPDAVQTVLDVSAERGIAVRTVKMEGAQQLRDTAPSPYGVFGIVRDGALLSYYYVLPKDLRQMLG